VITTGPWFSPGTPVSFTNETDHHDTTELWFKGALSTIALTHYFSLGIAKNRQSLKKKQKAVSNTPPHGRESNSQKLYGSM
jgi:hypothetical protein